MFSPDIISKISSGDIYRHRDFEKQYNELNWIRFQTVNGQLFQNPGKGVSQPNPALTFLIQGDPDLSHMENAVFIRLVDGSWIQLDDLENGEHMSIKGKLASLSEKTSALFDANHIPEPTTKLNTSFNVKKMPGDGIFRITSTHPRHAAFYLLIQI